MEDDDTLMLKEDHTLKAAGIGEKECAVPAGVPACMAALGDYTWITHHTVNATLVP